MELGGVIAGLRAVAGRPETVVVHSDSTYVLGGIIPLAPYVFVHDVGRALVISAGMTILALFVFGALKGKLTGTPPLISGLQAATIGGLAAGTAFMLARLIAR